jgi:hypothetical protein
MFSKPDYIILIAAFVSFYFRFLYGSASSARKIETPEFLSDYGCLPSLASVFSLS